MRPGIATSEADAPSQKLGALGLPIDPKALVGFLEKPRHPYGSVMFIEE